MKLGIMQPYFFPYIGYFDLINRTDCWVVFDIVKYNPRSWMNRNRILHPKSGWQYVNVPIIKASQNYRVSNVEMVDISKARQKLLSQIIHYKKEAPYYENVVDVINYGFSNVSSTKLVDLNVSCLLAVCDYLSLPINIKKCSELELDFPENCHAGQWALEISDSLGATEYINPSGGKNIFKEQEFNARRIDLKFTPMTDYKYNCGTFEFEESLSILDVIMWNSPSEVIAYLNKVSMNW